MGNKYEKPLTLDEISKVADRDIDTQDIPELDENYWKNAKVMPPKTQQNGKIRSSDG